MSEFNLLQNFPKVRRASLNRESDKNPEIKRIALQEGFEYYDGDRKFGFGGYVYDGRWQSVARLAKERYNLTKDSKVLVERTEKGFLVHDLKQLVPGITVYGTHRSEYPLQHAMDGFGRYTIMHSDNSGREVNIIEQEARQKVEPFLIKATTTDLPFKDNYFDTVISVNSVCNYEGRDCRRAIREITRVSKNNGKNSYIHVDSWRTPAEKDALMKWVLLTKAFYDTKSWEKMYKEEGFCGDWGFIIFNEENY